MPRQLFKTLLLLPSAAAAVVVVVVGGGGGRSLRQRLMVSAIRSSGAARL